MEEVNLSFERVLSEAAGGLYVRVPIHLVRRHGLKKGDYVEANLKVLKGNWEEGEK